MNKKEGKLRKRMGLVVKDGDGFKVFYGFGGGPARERWFGTRIEARHFLLSKPEPTAYEMIRYHMHRHEMDVLKMVREANWRGAGFMFGVGFGHGVWGRAMERLENRGVVKYRKSHCSRSWNREGYWVVTKTKGSK